MHLRFFGRGLMTCPHLHTRLEVGHSKGQLGHFLRGAFRLRCCCKVLLFCLRLTKFSPHEHSRFAIPHSKPQLQTFLGIGHKILYISGPTRNHTQGD